MKPESIADTAGHRLRPILRLGTFSAATAVTSMTVGALVLTGWALDLPVLKGILPHLPSMKVNAALCSLLGGVSLWLARKQPEHGGSRLQSGLSRAAAAAMVLLALATSGEYVFGWDLGIDQLLFRKEPGVLYLYPPGRMAPQAALIVLLLGCGLLGLDFKRRLGQLTAQASTLAGCILAYAEVVGFAYSLLGRAGLHSVTGIALPAALAFFVLGLGILVARPEREPGAVFTRNLARPMARASWAAVLLIVSVGGLVLLGQLGGFYGSEMEIPILVAVLTPAALTTIYFSVRSLEREQRKRIADRQREADRLRSLLESSPDGVVVVNHRRAITFASLKAEEVFGYSRGELEDQQVEILVPPHLRGENARHFERYLAGSPAHPGVYMWEQYALRKDGSEFPVEVAVARVQTGGEQQVFATIRDVTERKRVEEALQHSEAALVALVNRAPYAIYRSSEAGRFTMANPALIRMLGYDSIEEVMALDLSRDVYRDAGDRTRVLAALRSQGSFQDLALRWKRKDGTDLFLRASGRFVPEEGGGGHFEAIAEDVTLRHQLEEELRQVHKIEAFGQIAGGVAHNFSNILTGINLFVGLISQSLPKSGVQRHRIEEVLRATEQGSQLVSQLLTFSRQREVLPQALDLNAAIREEGEMLKRIIPEDIELVMSLTKELETVRMDRTQIAEVLLNLFINARDAMPNGGKLVVETTNVLLDENYARQHSGVVPGPYVLLSVSDTGTGMSARVRKRVFEPFFTTKPIGRGTGLGLSTVYGTVKESGGHVTIYSQPGLGTTFKVFLPRIRAGVQPTAYLPEAQKRSADPSETILLVEDEPSIREAARQYLTTLGYKVLSAPDGQEALNCAQEYGGQIDLILTDIVMPRIGGPELAKRMKEVRPTTKVLYMSGYSKEVLAGHLRRGSKVPLLQKPFTLDMLDQAIRKVLDTRVGAPGSRRS